MHTQINFQNSRTFSYFANFRQLRITSDISDIAEADIGADATQLPAIMQISVVVT